MLLQKFSKKVLTILKEHHKGGVINEDCLGCSSPCCSAGGFAILENVIMIYERYKKNDLQREDFQFESGLAFKDFVFRYFDVYHQSVGKWFWKKGIVFFHMKSLTQDNNLISLSMFYSYWEERYKLFEQNPWLSRGCVFLSKKVPNWPQDDKDSSRHCILHAKESSTHLTEKPIDCIFYTCNKPIDARTPTRKLTEKWFNALAKDYPNSVERFKKLIGE